MLRHSVDTTLFAYIDQGLRTPDLLIGRVSAAADMAIGGAATVSMALGATLVNFVGYRFIFATAAVVLLTTGTHLWRDCRKRQTTAAAQVVRDVAGQPPENHPQEVIRRFSKI